MRNNRQIKRKCGFFHFIKEKVEYGLINIKQYLTDTQTAGSFTVVLGTNKFENFKTELVKKGLTLLLYIKKPAIIKGVCSE